MSALHAPRSSPPPASPALWSATQMMESLRKRDISSAELLATLLDRIDLLNPSLNAVVVRDPDAAMVAAREADRRRMRGDEAALLGLPMTVKDTYATAGMLTTCGLPSLANHVPRHDAEAVARLRRAGAVIIGKTNVPAGGADHQSSNPVYGFTRNPWDLGRTPGGSSGGPAAAVAAGLTPVELGSDIGGSVRVPAHFCGIFGHKSTYGVIPLSGHIPPAPPGSALEAPLSVAGPLARHATDLELLLDVLAGADPVRGAAWSLTLPNSRHHAISDFRVAVWAQDFPYATSNETASALDSLAEALRGLGVQVSTTARPDLAPDASFDIYLRTLLAIVLAGQPFHLAAENVAVLPEDAMPFYRLFQQSSTLDLGSWNALGEARAVLRQRWREFFTDWDVLITPAFATTAFPHDHSGGYEFDAQLTRRRDVDGTEIPYLQQLAWPGLATVSDLPATAVPMPREHGRLPLGLQLIGAEFGDRTVLRLAALLENELGCVAAVPPLAVHPTIS